MYEVLIVEWLEFLFLNPWYAIPILVFQFAVLVELKIRYGKLFLPFEIWFAIQDWVVNLSFTVVFRDLPAKPFELVTGRMKRYINDYNAITNLSKKEAFRLRFALKLCALLNRYEKGHC